MTMKERDNFSKNKTVELLKDITLSIIAALIAAINMNSFVHAAGIFTGGFSGISLLLNRVSETFWSFTLNYSLMYFLFNIPAVLLVFRSVGKRFTLISLIDVALTSLLVQILPRFNITDDLLLLSVFGGILNGLSNSLVLSANGCGGGTDFIAIYVSKKYKRSVWTQSMAINVIIILISGVLFGWETALYSIIFQYVSTQVVSATDSRYKRSCFFIITDKSNEVCQAIYQQLHHSVTILDGVGGFTQTPRKVLYTVCGQYESNMLVEIVMGIDPHAFVNITDSKRLVGNFHEKPF